MANESGKFIISFINGSKLYINQPNKQDQITGITGPKFFVDDELHDAIKYVMHSFTIDNNLVTEKNGLFNELMQKLKEKK